jgi:hypothetical protein
VNWHWLRHEWGKWKLCPIRVVPHQFGLPLESLARLLDGQVRECIVCGIRQLRRVE